MAPQRVAEAKKLGFEICIVPKVCEESLREIKGIRILFVRTVQDAVDCLASLEE